MFRLIYRIFYKIEDIFFAIDDFFQDWLFAIDSWIYSRKVPGPRSMTIIGINPNEYTEWIKEEKVDWQKEGF